MSAPDPGSLVINGNKNRLGPFLSRNFFIINFLTELIFEGLPSRSYKTKNIRGVKEFVSPLESFIDSSLPYDSVGSRTSVWNLSDSIFRSNDTGDVSGLQRTETGTCRQRRPKRGGSNGGTSSRLVSIEGRVTGVCGSAYVRGTSTDGNSEPGGGREGRMSETFQPSSRRERDADEVGESGSTKVP